MTYQLSIKSGPSPSLALIALSKRTRSISKSWTTIWTTRCESVTQHFVVNIRSSFGFPCGVTTCLTKCFETCRFLLAGNIELLLCDDSFAHSGVLKHHRCRKPKPTPSTVATSLAVMLSLFFHPSSCRCVKWRCTLLLQVRSVFKIMLAIFPRKHGKRIEPGGFV